MKRKFYNYFNFGIIFLDEETIIYVYDLKEKNTEINII
jgi:hypothetical protein